MAFQPVIPTSFGSYAAEKLKAAEAGSRPIADENDYNNRVTPIIDSVLKGYGNDAEDLRLRANILAQQAVQSYDKTHGASMETHIRNNLQRLNRYRAERQSAMKVPEQQIYDKKKITDFMRSYQDENGYEPSDLAISENFGFNQKRVRQILGRKETPLSMMDNEKGESVGVYNRDPKKVWLDYVYHDLDDKNRRIMEWTTGYNGSPILPKGEIARRLSISGAAISGRVSSIQKRIDEANE
jgi:DNA-directed RNA polymerase specialized sigma subunit